MSQLSKIPPSVSSEQLVKHYGSIILNELPQESVIKVLVGHLMKLAKLYQLKDFDSENAVLISHWITQNYKYEALESVTRCLENPPSIGEKIWRITPDVVQSWMAAYLDRVYAQREKEIHNEKYHIEGFTGAEEEPDPRLEEWLKTLEGSKGVRSITEEEIKAEGQVIPKQPSYVPPDAEYFILNQMRVKYGRECTDKYSGDVLPGMPSFEEWLLLQK